MIRTYKYKLYSTKRLRHLNQRVDIAGIIYNHCIALHKRYYKLFGKSLNKFQLQKHLTKLKKLPKYEYWKRVPSQAIQEIIDRITQIAKKEVVAKKYEYIAIEDLNIKAMQRLWGRKISDLAFS